MGKKRTSTALRRRTRFENYCQNARRAAEKRSAFFALRDKEARMAPKKPKFVGEVPVINRLGGGEEGQVVGTARIEDLHGTQIVHIDMAGKSADILRRGFSLGEFTESEGESEDDERPGRYREEGFGSRS